jgi:hypothetical protein
MDKIYNLEIPWRFNIFRHGSGIKILFIYLSAYTFLGINKVNLCKTEVDILGTLINL